jgi:hypothetical protein
VKETTMNDAKISDPIDRSAAERGVHLPDYEWEGPPVSDAEAAYYAELEAEQERLAKLPRVDGLSAVDEDGECDRCGERAVLYGRTACTLGYPGHPGAEFTTFQICAPCAQR